MNRTKVIGLVLAAIVVFCVIGNVLGRQTDKKELKHLQKENQTLLEKINEQKTDSKEELSAPKLLVPQEIQSKISEQDTLSRFAKEFFSAEYDYTVSYDRITRMKPYATDRFIEIYNNPAFFSGDPDAPGLQSVLKSADIYRVQVSGDSAHVVARISTGFFVSGSEEIINHFLIELTLVKENGGDAFLVDSQTVYPLQM